MIRKALFAIAFAAGVAFLYAMPTYAQSVQIQPLLYREAFKPGEVKKGFVDVANPSASTLTLVPEIQAFKQIDNDGNLQFFDSEAIEGAITPDLSEFELKPKEALRMYFVIDSKKLPGGDNFAALFLRSKGDSKNGIGTSVRVGTLLVLQNGDPGPREAEVVSLSGDLFQWGRGAEATAAVKNTADPTKSTAFFPVVKASLKPFGSNVTVDQPPASPLIFAGITRKVNLELPSNVIGFYRLEVSAGKNTASKWVFLVTGFWRWVVIVSLIVVPVAATLWWKLRSRRHTHYKNR